MAKKIYHATTTLSQERYAAIGKLMVCWGALEFAAGNMMAKALGLPAKEGRIATSRLGLRSKMEALILVARLRKADVAEHELADHWNKVLKPLEAHRNDMAHGVWMVPNAGGTTGVRLVKIRGGDSDENRILGKHQKIPTKEISKFATDAESAITTLTSLWRQHKKTLVP